MKAMIIDQIAFGTKTLVQECHHKRPSLLLAISYCGCVATAFVLSLYALVPSEVRRLDRDNPVQIKWRTYATGAVCLGAIIGYPFIFCDDDGGNNDNISSDNYYYEDGGNQSVLERMGLFVPNLPLRNHVGALAHSMVLYMGPIMILMLQAKLMAESSQSTPSSPPPAAATYLQCLQAVLFPSSSFIPSEVQKTAQRWITLRNKVIAPILEEVAFRGCMVPVLTATGIFHPGAVAWIAPIFFGVAHCHHATLKLRQGEALSRVLLTTAFQFLYTTLFGAYAAHAFLRSKSLVAVMLTHSFCNTMGLPSLDFFFNKNNPLYSYKKRMSLMKAHILGLAIFVWGFFTANFLPLPTTIQ